MSLTPDSNHRPPPVGPALEREEPCAEARWVRLLFRSDMLEIGALRQYPDSPGWTGNHDTGPGVSLGFPRRPMEYQRDHHDWVVGSANTVFLNNPNSIYQRRKIDPAGEYTEWLRFDLETALDVIRHHDPGSADLGNESVRKPLTLRTDDVFRDQVQLHTALKKARDNSDSLDPLLVEETALDLLDRTVRIWVEEDGRDCEPLHAETERAHRRVAHEAARYIASRFRTKLDAAGIAREIGVSRPTLFRAFRVHNGMPVHKYVTTLRLREAYVLLEKRKTPLTELALDLGFSSHAHFTSLFRREFGTPPSRVASR